MSKPYELADTVLTIAQSSNNAIQSLRQAIQESPPESQEEKRWETSLQTILDTIPNRPSLDQINPPFNASWLPNKFRERFCKQQYQVDASFLFLDASVVSLATYKDSTAKTAAPLWGVTVVGQSEANTVIDGDQTTETLEKQAQTSKALSDKLWGEAASLVGSEEALETIKASRNPQNIDAQIRVGGLGLGEETLQKAHALISESTITRELYSTCATQLAAVKDGDWRLKGSKTQKAILAIGDCTNSESGGLLSAYLRGKPIIVQYEKTVTTLKGDKKVWLDSQVLSELAEAKLDELLESWRTWLQSLPEDDIAEIENLYFDLFGGRSRPNFDGLGELYSVRQALHLAGVPYRNVLDPDHDFYLRDFQIDAILRFAKSGGIIGHEVGLGKTAIAVCVYALRRFWGQLDGGMAVFFVPKQVVDDWQKTFATLLPEAKVEVLSASTMKKAYPKQPPFETRTTVLARMVAMGTEVIIASREEITKIPCSPQDINAFFDEVKEEYLGLKEKIDASTCKVADGAVATALSKIDDAKDRLSKESPPECGFYWDMLNVRLVFIDEFQDFKRNLLASSYAQDIAGLSLGQSRRARELELKLAAMRRRGIKHPAIALTGTPEPTNSISGLFSALWMLCPEELKRIGCSSFDSFLMTFGRVEALPELKANGRYKVTPRLRGFNESKDQLIDLYLNSLDFKIYGDVAHNFAGRERPTAKIESIGCDPSALQIWLQKLVVKLYEDLRNPDRDATQKMLFRDGQIVPCGWILSDKETALVSQTRAELAKMSEEELAQRDKALARIKNGKKKRIPITEEIRLKYKDQRNRILYDKSDRNYLTVYDLMRSTALCSHLVDIPTILANFVAPGSPVEPLLWNALNGGIPAETEKPMVAAREAARIYHETAKHKATQLIVLDRVEIKYLEGATLPKLIRSELVRQGVKEEEIALIWDWDDKGKRKELYAAMNSGDIRILISSRLKVGIGTNIQKRLFALHQLDVPFRPDEWQQTNGRIERQGNLCQEIFGRVHIYQYLTRGHKVNDDGTHGIGADAVSFQLLSQKIGVRCDLLRGKPQEDGNEFSEEDSQQGHFTAFFAEATNGSQAVEFFNIKLRRRKLAASILSSQGQLDKLCSSNPKRSGSIAYWEREITLRTQQLRRLEAEKAFLEERITPASEDFTEITVGGTTFVGKGHKVPAEGYEKTYRQARIDAAKAIVDALSPNLDDIEPMEGQTIKESKKLDNLIQYRGVSLGGSYIYEMTIKDGEIKEQQSLQLYLMDLKPQIRFGASVATASGTTIASIDKHIDSSLLRNQSEQAQVLRAIQTAEASYTSAVNSVEKIEASLKRAKLLLSDIKPEYERLKDAILMQGIHIPGGL